MSANGATVHISEPLAATGAAPQQAALRVVDRISRIITVVPSLGPATRAWRRLGFEISEPAEFLGCRAADLTLDGGGVRFLAPEYRRRENTTLAALVDERLVLGAGILGWTWGCENVAHSFASLGASNNGLFTLPSDVTPGVSTFLEPLSSHASAEHPNSVRALDHVVLDLSDASAAADVYARTFGLLPRLRRTTHRRYVLMKVGGSAVEIVGPAQPQKGPPTGHAWGLAFGTRNLDDTVAMLRERGIDVAQPQATPGGRRILSLPLQLGGVGIAFVGD